MDCTSPIFINRASHRRGILAIAASRNGPQRARDVQQADAPKAHQRIIRAQNRPAHAAHEADHKHKTVRREKDRPAAMHPRAGRPLAFIVLSRQTTRTPERARLLPRVRHLGVAT